MKDLTKQISDWNKLKNAQDKVKESPLTERTMHIQNFYFGVKAYFEKYGTKFNYHEEPK